jgi:hypothetical protein
MLPLIQRGRRGLTLIVALFVLYRFYIWKKYDDFIRQSGLKVLPLTSTNPLFRPLGNFIRQITNWYRVYDLKLENFKSVGDLTIAVPAPIWCEFGVFAYTKKALTHFP